MYDILIDSQSIVSPTSCHCRPSLDIVISDMYTVSNIPLSASSLNQKHGYIENKKINS